MTHLLLTVRFLDDHYHGLLDRNGPPEWPPSPFRLFCALVAGVARRGELEGGGGKALEWLQTLEPPVIIAPKSMKGQPILRYVPNNDGDKKFDRQGRLTAKPTIPTLMRLQPNEKPEVHYLWNIVGKVDVPLEKIRDAARSLTTLGWGVDMAFADAKTVIEADVQSLLGIRWYPKLGVWRDEGMLRVPVVGPDLQECTLCDLKHCHQATIDRIEHGKPLHTVGKPQVFEQIFYASVERQIGRPYRVFEFRNTDGSRFSYPHGKLIHIAGMVRHLAIEAMKKSPPQGVAEDWVRTYVAGHAAGNVSGHHQVSYLPLPSIGTEHTDPGIRRVMIMAPIGDDHLLDYIARRIGGMALEPLGDEFGGQEPPMLVPVKHDSIARLYAGSAKVWHSFTPVILPGHDDHNLDKRHSLIEKALRQAGIDQACEFEASAFSRFRKSYSAHKYGRDKRPQGYIRPDYLLSQTAVHLTLRFQEEVPGPIVLGAGRHVGLGLFAPIDSP
jgi:CRISPR-associated protein Csb2